MLNKNSFVVYVSIVLLTVLILQSCNRDKAKCDDPRNPDCINYNPCFGAEKTSAYFTMTENIRPILSNSWFKSDTIRYETDTCTDYNLITIRCTQKTDSIWWIFDDNYMRPSWQQQQQFNVRFTLGGGLPVLEPEWVKITCIVKNNKPNPCFPEDDGIDTFTRYMVFMPPFKTGFDGTYRGSFDYKPDSVFEFDIRWDSILNHDNFYEKYITFDKFLTQKPIHSRDIWEYARPSMYGYYGFFMDFSAARGHLPPEFRNYNGLSHRGKVIYNPKTKTIQIDFVRGHYVIPIWEWPPKGLQLHRFTGVKIN